MYKYNEYRKAWRAKKRAENPEAFLAKQRDQDKNRDPEKRKASNRAYTARHYEKILEKNAARRAANPEKYKESQRKTSARPESKMGRICIRKISELISRKSSRYCEWTGCTKEQAVAHIESQFKAGWTWENHGKIWEIDHILPLSAFDLSDETQIKIACNWQNLRPLEKRKNRSKSAKLTEPQMPLPISLCV